MHDIIGTRHSLIRLCRGLLRHGRVRKEEEKFLVEGMREIQCAQHQKWDITHVFYGEEADKDTLFTTLDIPLDKWYATSRKAFEHIAYRNNRNNIVALVKTQNHALAKIIPSPKTQNPKSCLLVLVGIANPGNLGAIIRTAWLSHTEAILLADSRIDIYHPNVIRNSLGASLCMPIGVGRQRRSDGMACAVCRKSKTGRFNPRIP